MIKAKVISYLIGVILRELKPEMVKEFADHVLDWVEDKILGTENKLDDKLIPLITMIRTTFDIPDND